MPGHIGKPSQQILYPYAFKGQRAYGEAPKRSPYATDAVLSPSLPPTLPPSLICVCACECCVCGARTCACTLQVANAQDLSFLSAWRGSERRRGTWIATTGHSLAVCRICVRVLARVCVCVRVRVLARLPASAASVDKM